MRRAVASLLAAWLCVAGIAADAAEPASPDAALAQMLPVAAGSPFSGPVVLRGTLGNDTVQADLHAKADPAEGFEGDYFLTGQAFKTLLAGELDGTEDVFMEESPNGKDVSGQWRGKLKGALFSGTWQSADGLVTKPFRLEIVRSGQTMQPQQNRQASADTVRQ